MKTLLAHKQLLTAQLTVLLPKMLANFGRNFSSDAELEMWADAWSDGLIEIEPGQELESCFKLALDRRVDQGDRFPLTVPEIKRCWYDTYYPNHRLNKLREETLSRLQCEREDREDHESLDELEN